MNRGNLESVKSNAVKALENMTEVERARDDHHLVLREVLLADKESLLLLGRLLTDLRMKDVWNALAKRSSNDNHFFLFLFACVRGLRGWQLDRKYTASERKALSQELQSTIALLDALIKKTGLDIRFSMADLISTDTVSRILQDLRSSRDISFGRLVIGGRLPKITDILVSLSTGAQQYGEEEPTDRRPNGENADIRYFVRNLSQYLRQKYRQPLHEVVSSTTEVVFDRRDISSDYVRDLVRRYP
jgi:hypothetical protein